MLYSWSIEVFRLTSNEHRFTAPTFFLLMSNGCCTSNTPLRKSWIKGATLPCLLVRASTTMLGCGAHLIWVLVFAKACRITCISSAVRLSLVTPVVSRDKWSYKDFASTIPKFWPSSVSPLQKSSR